MWGGVLDDDFGFLSLSLSLSLFELPFLFV
jgi:hypothetical protein